MSFYDAIRVGASGAADSALTIDRSARFRGATDQRFDRTLSSTSSSYTVSMWFKVTPVTTNFSRGLFTLGPANNTDVAGVVFNTSDSLIFYGGNGTSSITNARVFRDTSAWYHFTYSVNSNNFTAYINGESLQTGTVRSLDTTSNGFRLGGWWGGYDLFRGYIADFYLIDGSALTPSSFTETNAETGQLVPKLYTGSFGTSGAHLLFNDNSGTTATTLGKDSSSNSNNFTPTNFITGDSVNDSPTNNFPTWNPLSTSALPTLSDGNLKNLGDNNKACNATFGVTSGKWYWEIHVLTDISSTAYIVASGVTGYEMVNDGDVTPRLNYDTSKYSYYKVTSSGGYTQYKRYTDTNLTEASSGGTFMGGAVLGFRLDMDAGTLKFYTNNTLVHTDSTIPTDGTVIFPMQNATNSGVSRHNASIVNFGQDGTFAGNKTAQGNTDGGGIGNFFYAVPSGFKAICSANLPDPTILLPNKQFETVIYSGDGNSTRSITGVEFQPDWVWLKIRSASYHHKLYDAVRGAGSLKALASSTTGAEGSDLDNSTYGFVNSFDANGFSVTKGSSSTSFTNGGSATYVAWNWNAGDTDSATYTVKVVSDSGNKYRFNNFGTSAVTLDLAEGGTYTFDGSDSSMSGHPFVIGTAANGSVYSTGVTYQLDGASVSYSAYTSGYSSASTRKLIITVPASAPVLYYWCSIHSGMGGQINTNTTLGSSNFDGTTQTTVKANASAGFSIVTYTGDGTTGSTIGHGLGVKPDSIIIKRRSSSSDWMVYHKGVNGGVSPEDYYLSLNNTNAQTNSTIMLNDTAPTSSVVTLYANSAVNSSGHTYVMYCFSEVAGYSKFGSYIPNQNDNGPFVFTGFTPRWILLKSVGNIYGGGSPFSGNWYILDTARSTFNVAASTLATSSNSAEDTAWGAEGIMDILSNGFKIRTDSLGINATLSGYFIYFAFAEASFKNSRAR